MIGLGLVHDLLTHRFGRFEDNVRHEEPRFSSKNAPVATVEGCPSRQRSSRNLKIKSRDDFLAGGQCGIQVRVDEVSPQRCRDRRRSRCTVPRRRRRAAPRHAFGSSGVLDAKRPHNTDAVSSWRSRDLHTNLCQQSDPVQL